MPTADGTDKKGPASGIYPGNPWLKILENLSGLEDGFRTAVWRRLRFLVSCSCLFSQFHRFYF